MEHFSDDVDGVLGALGEFLRGGLTGLDDTRLPDLLLKGYDLGLGNYYIKQGFEHTSFFTIIQFFEIYST